MFLLFACLALTIAAEKGKLKYLIISMICVGLGFNVKMLQAYMVVPALYITYLLATSISFTKRIGHLIIGTVILIIVSLSWAVIVDLVPSNNRPFVDSSTNNTVTELILGHNGSERISFSSKKSKQGGAPNGGHVDKGGAGQNNNSSNPIQNNKSVSNSGNGPQANGRQMGGGPSKASGPQSSGSLQEQTTQGITRLFSKNVLSDQIVWFIPLAIFGMFAAFFKEKVGLKLDNKRKQSLILWSVWFVPVFLYFSFNTGTSHPYYLTMLAPPTAALAGIGITAMWTFYKEGGWKSWLLPIALLANGAAQLLMLYYFISYSSIVKVLMVLLIILCFVSSIVLSILNLVKNKNDDNVIRLKKILVGAAFLGLLLTPFVGSSTVIFTKVNGSFPAAGLELLSGSSRNDGMSNISSSSKLIEFLEKNNTTEKYLLVVSTSGDASNIIIKTGKPVMTLGGFGGSDNIISLNKFKQMVKNGEVRYVMVSSSRSMNNQNSSENSNSAIMSWAQKNGTLVSTSKYSNVDQTNNNSNSMTPKMGMSGQLYDLKTYTDSNNTK